MMRRIIDSSFPLFHRGFSAKSAAPRDFDGVKGLFLRTPTIDFSCIHCADDAVRLFHEMIAMSPKPSVPAYNKLLSCTVKLEEYRVAFYMFDKMRQCGVDVNLCSMSISINCYCLLHRVELGFALLGSLFKLGYKPNVTIFSTLLKGLVLVGKFNEAEALFRKILRLKLCVPNDVMILTLMSGLCKNGLSQAARDLLQVMEKANLKPNVKAYSAVIDGFCKNRMVDDAILLVSEMVRKGVSPNAVTYNSIIWALCSLGRWGEVKHLLLVEMVNLRVPSDLIHFNTLLDALCKHGKLDEAEDVLEIMVQMNVSPDIFTYTSLICGYCSRGKMDRAKEAFDSIAKRGLKHNIMSYTNMINGYCKNGDVDEARLLFDEIPRIGLKHKAVSYNIMLDGLFSADRFADGWKLFNDMEASQVHPDLYTYNTLLEGLYRNLQVTEMIPILRVMKERGIAPDIVTYNIIINGLCKVKEFDAARYLLDSLPAKGLRSNVRTYTTLIGSLYLEGRDEEAKELLIKMEEHGCPPNRMTYNAIISSLIKRNELHKAMPILEEMCKRGFSASPGAFAMAAEKLRDLSQPMDVVLLDATVAAFYGTGSKEERVAADHILRDLQNNPDMWLQVVHILSNAQNLNTKFFALQVLEGVIKYRWNALPVEQRDGMKNYISDVIVKLSTDEVSFRRERLYVNKLNIILVQILKHEWPARWRSFIPDLVAAAKTSETICENCMAILKLLSEEVFDFSRGEMTQQKIKELKQSMNSEFQLIHELCLYVLSASQRAELVRATLATLHAFLSWIPLGYIFESPLLETLLSFFPVLAYRNLTLQCLTEVAALSFGDFYNMQYVKMYGIFMVQLQKILPSNTNFLDAYANGTSEEQAFIQNLALFFTSYYKSHIRVLESSQENINLLLVGLEYLINISYVDDTEVFKVCLDYWNSLVSELFEAHHNLENSAGSNMDFKMPMLSGVVDGLGSQPMQRRQLYAIPMSKLRQLMICRMAKPEEVLIVEDENGNIVRETMKDNDVLVQYKIMRETLIYLANLDHEDTEMQMLKKLSKQLDGEDWNWNNLNTLCWAIGSISGSMGEEQENRFLVMVIRDLLNLCEMTKGKDNKAVIASNIMYVVGQYPRFLRAHWKFLKTVVNKLFEFMHETHPGVQDMACDTFLKIVQKCKRKFVIVQVGENEPFVSELLNTLPATITDLEPHQIHSFYESVGHMIQAEPDPDKRTEYLLRLMGLPNQKWAEIIGQARQSVDFLKDPDVIRAVLNILQTNTCAASALGTYFLTQISLIFLDMLNVYKMYSELISTSIAQGGPYASRTSIVKLLRSVKREVLKLIETFLDKAEDQPHIGKQFVPPMMDPVLGDYARNLPDARESEVLSLFATIINKYKGAMLEDVPKIFEAAFQCTLEMITKNFEDYPEHRLKFFSLLRAIATHCFPAMIRLSSEQLKLVMDSIIWAFRHTERNIAETGLHLLLEILKNFQASKFCNQFFRTYFLTIEQEIFAVLTDTFHKPGFKLHVLVLQHLLCLVESGMLTEPLWDAATVQYPYPNNGMFIREYTIKLLSTSFPNMTTAEVTQFVSRLYESREDLPSFRSHIRDFLVQSKEFSAQDNKDLYAEEAAAQRERERQRMLSIPGLIAPNEIQDEMVDS